MKIKTNGDKIDVPESIGHKYFPFRYIPIDYLNGVKAKKHKRIGVFARKGCKCCVPGCEHEGVFLIVGLSKKGDFHIDLYTKDFMLMTVDHRKPLGEGGEDNWENKYPMCNNHNAKKGQQNYEEFLQSLNKTNN